MAWKKIEINKKDEAFAKVLKGKMKFLVDENMGIVMAELLRDLGYKATHTSEVKLNSKDDSQIFAYAYKHGYTLITHDEDFLDNTKFPFKLCYGVVILPFDDASLIEAMKILHHIISGYKHAYFNSKIIINGDRTLKIQSVDDTGKVKTHRYRALINKLPEIWQE